MNMYVWIATHKWRWHFYSSCFCCCFRFPLQMCDVSVFFKRVALTNKTIAGLRVAHSEILYTMTTLVNEFLARIQKRCGYAVIQELFVFASFLMVFHSFFFFILRRFFFSLCGSFFVYFDIRNSELFNIISLQLVFFWKWKSIWVREKHFKVYFWM